MTFRSIFIGDTNDALKTSIALTFLGIEVTCVTSLQIINIDKKELDKYDAIFIEVACKETYQSILLGIKEKKLHIPVVLHASLMSHEKYTDIRIAGYYSHPLDKKQLSSAIEFCQELSGKIKLFDMDKMNLTGSSHEIQTVRRMISKVTTSSTNVLITGESGTGKELIARAIHYTSNRKNGPFVPVNCAAIPKELLESELFGHDKGAFTGAITTYKGRFEIADGGTIFLDEIGDMPSTMQVKLLRVLQEKVFERVGSSKTTPTNVRIIAATHKNLGAMITNGEFREDLYFRLNVYPIHSPSLSSRYNDIPQLIDNIEQKLKERGFEIASLAPNAIASLMQHNWPGNIRELSNLIERLAITHGGKLVNVNDLPEKYQYNIKLTHKIKNDIVTNTSSQKRNNKDSDNKYVNVTKNDRDFILDSMNENTKFEMVIKNTPLSIPSNGLDLKEFINHLEKKYIIAALSIHNGIVSKAADSLGIQRTTLVEKMRRLGVNKKSR